MRTLLNAIARRLADHAGRLHTGKARVERVALWLVFLLACNVSAVFSNTPRAVQGIAREVKGV